MAADAEMLARLVTTLSYLLHLQMQKDVYGPWLITCLPLPKSAPTWTKWHPYLGGWIEPLIHSRWMKAKVHPSPSTSFTTRVLLVYHSLKIFSERLEVGGSWCSSKLIHLEGENVVNYNPITCGFGADWASDSNPVDESKWSYAHLDSSIIWVPPSPPSFPPTTSQKIC